MLYVDKFITVNKTQSELCLKSELSVKFANNKNVKYTKKSSIRSKEYDLSRPKVNDLIK